jgi:O-antigen/teichoic acid export membrane protein
MLLPIGVMAGGLQLLFQAWHVHGGELKTVGLSKLAQSVSTLVLSVGAGLSSAGALGLILSYLVGFWVAVGMLVRGQLRLIKHITSTGWRRLKRAYTENKREILFSAMLGMVNVAMLMSLTLLISTFYDARTVGSYSLVFRVATAPIGLLTAALVHSFWADAAEMAKSNPSGLRSFYIQTMRRLSVIALAILPFTLLAPYYVDVIFGAEKWAGTGMLLLAVTPFLIGMIIFSPTTHLIVYGKQHWQLVVDLSVLILSGLIFWQMASKGFEAWQAIMASSTVMLLGYLVRLQLHLIANRRLIEIKK